MSEPTARVVRHVTQFAFCLASEENTAALHSELNLADRSELEWWYLEALRLVSGFVADKAKEANRSVEAELAYLLDAAIAARDCR